MIKIIRNFEAFKKSRIFWESLYLTGLPREWCPICLQLTVFSQVIVCVGGEDDKVVMRSVEFWHPATSVWKEGIPDQISCPRPKKQQLYMLCNEKKALRKKGFIFTDIKWTSKEIKLISLILLFCKIWF